MKDTIRWGIIGCGRIAQKFASDLALVPEAELSAVAARSITSAKAFAEQHHAKRYYGDYKELCLDQAVDIIYIATPHNSHKDLSILAMLHGKHVLCEKPMSVNYEEAKDIIHTAKKMNLFFMEAMWTRFNPTIEKVLSIIKADIIGDVNYINADFCFTKPFDSQSRLFDPMLAGGALLDIGVYPLFLSYQILGKPKEIKSTMIRHENGIDLQTAMILIYEKANAMLLASIMNRAEMIGKIHGTKGSINIQAMWHQAQSFDVIIDGETEHYDIPTIGHGFSHEIEECHSCLKQSLTESRKWSHADCLYLAEMTDTIRKQNDFLYPFEQ